GAAVRRHRHGSVPGEAELHVAQLWRADPTAGPAPLRDNARHGARPLPGRDGTGGPGHPRPQRPLVPRPHGRGALGGPDDGVPTGGGLAVLAGRLRRGRGFEEMLSDVDTLNQPMIDTMRKAGHLDGVRPWHISHYRAEVATLVDC